MSLHQRASALVAEFRLLLRSEAGTAVPEYALVSALFGLGGVLALLAVAMASTMQLTGVQGRVPQAVLRAPAP